MISGLHGMLLRYRDEMADRLAIVDLASVCMDSDADLGNAEYHGRGLQNTGNKLRAQLRQIESVLANSIPLLREVGINIADDAFTHNALQRQMGAFSSTKEVLRVLFAEGSENSS